jgi:hypothetical protein
MKQLPRSLSRPPVLPNLPNLLILPMLFRQAMPCTQDHACTSPWSTRIPRLASNSTVPEHLPYPVPVGNTCHENDYRKHPNVD